GPGPGVGRLAGRGAPAGATGRHGRRRTLAGRASSPPPGGSDPCRHQPDRGTADMSHDTRQYPQPGPEAAGTEVRWMVTEDMAAVCELPLWTAVGNLSGPTAALPPAATPPRRRAPARPPRPPHPRPGPPPRRTSPSRPPGRPGPTPSMTAAP